MTLCIYCFLFKFLQLHNRKHGPPLRQHTDAITIILPEREKKEDGMITFTPGM